MKQPTENVTHCVTFYTQNVKNAENVLVYSSHTSTENLQLRAWCCTYSDGAQLSPQNDC